jgi:hypothetical protein
MNGLWMLFILGVTVVVGAIYQEVEEKKLEHKKWELEKCHEHWCKQQEYCRLNANPKHPISEM